jgi:hypothetical protein
MENGSEYEGSHFHKERKAPRNAGVSFEAPKFAYHLVILSRISHIHLDYGFVSLSGQTPQKDRKCIKLCKGSLIIPFQITRDASH